MISILIMDCVLTFLVLLPLLLAGLGIFSLLAVGIVFFLWRRHRHRVKGVGV